MQYTFIALRQGDELLQESEDANMFRVLIWIEMWNSTTMKPSESGDVVLRFFSDSFSLVSFDPCCSNESLF